MNAWRREPLRSLGNWYGGGTPSKSRAEYWDGGDIPWLSPKDMGTDVLKGTKDHITAAAIAGSATRLVTPTSVAVVVRSGILERTIPVALVPFATTLNQDMKAIECRPDVDPRWVAWGLRAYERELLRTARKAGTTVASLEWGRFLGWELPVPPLAEQRQIVDILEDHLSRLDAAASYIHASQQRLDRLHVARWRSAFGALEEAHGQRGLLTVARIENGQTPRGLTERLLDHQEEGTVPFFKVGDMNAAEGRVMAQARFHVRLQDATELGLRVRQGGCVLIPKRGGAIATNKKRLLVGPAAYDLNTMGLRPTSDVSQEYLWHWLDGVDLGRISDGSNVPQINSPQIRRLELPVPPIDVQLRVCEELDGLTQRRDLLTEACRQASVRSELLRQALLGAAFSGRLTGRSGDLDLAKELAFA